MFRFHVTRKEIFDQIVEIDADDREEAIDLVADGSGDEIGEAEYHSTMNVDTWKCEEVKKPEVVVEPETIDSLRQKVESLTARNGVLRLSMSRAWRELEDAKEVTGE